MYPGQKYSSSSTRRNASVAASASSGVAATMCIVPSAIPTRGSSAPSGMPAPNSRANCPPPPSITIAAPASRTAVPDAIAGSTSRGSSTAQAKYACMAPAMRSAAMRSVSEASSRSRMVAGAPPSGAIGKSWICARVAANSSKVKNTRTCVQPPEPIALHS